MKLNRKMIGRARKLASEFRTITEICKALDIDRATYYDWLEKAKTRGGIYQDFADAIEDGRDEFYDTLEHGCLANIIKAKSWQSDAWILERMFPEKYARTNIRPYTNGDSIIDGAQRVLIQIEDAAESLE